MYEGFYELTATPFVKGTAIDKLYMPPELSEVENRLHFVAERHLFATLTGECGTGKSTILRRLSESLDPRKYQMLYVSDSKLTPSSYYHLLLEQMGISSSWNRSTAYTVYRFVGGLRCTFAFEAYSKVPVVQQELTI